MDAFTMDTNHNGKHIIYSKSVFYVNVLMLIKKNNFYSLRVQILSQTLNGFTASHKI